jgi:galactan 5-O-arabinofuranosyltransferase
MADTSGRWRAPALEAAVAFGAMGLFLALCPSIHVSPMLRIGAISGLASLQLRFAMIVLPLIIALIVTARVRNGAWFALTSRLACAAFAGLASAFIAGGVLVALRGTPYCLNAHNGDSGMLAVWANAFTNHNPADYPPPYYPPLFPHVLHWYMDLVDKPALYALKDLEIGITALIGPLAYLAWRLLLRPGWALGIGVVAALVIIEPYKPYEGLSLVLLVPLMIHFVQTLRHADDRTIQQLAKCGVAYGLGFGVLCLTYSGWFKWSAPGFVAAAACLVPWRGGRWKASALVGGIALFVFVAVVWSYFSDIHTYTKIANIGIGGKPLVQDTYVYFDVLVDPGYFAMWKGDLPGGYTPDWPPWGELAGVGLYPLLLFLGFGTAIALGRKRTMVITLACVLVGTWLMRFYYAHYVYETKLVQLYPRTSIELAYGFALMAGFAIYYVVEYFARKTPDGPLRSSSTVIGAMCTLAFVLGTAGSAISDRYMPANTAPRNLGWLSWAAHEATIAKTPPDPP